MGTNAMQRLTATARAIELPNFRYIDDITRYLEKMRDDVSESDELIRVQQEALAHLRRPRSWVGAALMKFSATAKSKVDPELKRVVIPNVKKLEQQYGLSEDLYEKYQTLEAVESQLAAQFPGRKGEAVERATGTLRALKKKVSEQMRTVLSFLTEVANEHVPKTFRKYVDAVMMSLEENIVFGNVEQFLYVHTDEGNLVFTHYILLKALPTEQGTFPRLYLSLQWTVGATVHVGINHEFELPAKLMLEPSVEVKSLGEAVDAMRGLLEAEGIHFPEK